MPLRRRTCLLAAGLLCMARASRASTPGSEEERAVAIERAAFQRALSQRIAKAYLMLAQGIEPALAGRLLEEARLAFERHLWLLKGMAPSAQASRLLAALDARWAECRATLQQPPTRAGAAELYRISDELQAAAHGVLLAFEAAYPSAARRGLMLAGRLRMLSERMAKFWLYRHWDLNRAPADMELHLARAHFTALLLQVQRLPLAPAAAAAAGDLRRRWPDYDRLLQAEPDAPAVELVRHSEQVFAAAQALVGHMLPRPGQASAATPGSTQAGPR